MLEYLKEYIENCRLIRELTASPYISTSLRNREQVLPITQRNTELIRDRLIPALEDIYSAEPQLLRELEAFAAELTKGPQSLDTPLACQIHEALLAYARRYGRREDVIRELYNLGMARYGLWYMVTGLSLDESSGFTMRMRYCFIEAASYLKYFDEFDDATRDYILRATANIYLGSFDNWRDKLERVRISMQIFTDPYYRETAPNLPWDRYMRSLHQQMIAVIPHTFAGGELTPDAVEDVMESAHLVYRQQLELALSNRGEAKASNLFSYYSLEFRCGLISKSSFLKQLEELLDSADSSQYDENNAYKIMSLPAFYSQYLDLMPEMVPPRRGYIAGIERRLIDYAEAFPPEETTDRMILYARQSLSRFTEVEGGMPYRDFAAAILRKFAPDIYVHGMKVGKIAAEICTAMTGAEDGYFDEIPELEGLSGEEKHAALYDLALYSGLLHDLGELNFTSIFDRCGRQMLASEEELLQLHTLAGNEYLGAHRSTLCAASVASGHHRYYDGSEGYPSSYVRKGNKYRSIVDVIAVTDYLMDSGGSSPDAAVRTFDENVARALEMAGRRFSPMVTAWLRDADLMDRLHAIVAGS